MSLNQNHQCSNRNEDTGILPWAGSFHVPLAELSARWSLLPFTKSSEALPRVVITAICWVWRLPPDASLLLNSAHLYPISSHCSAVCTQERSLPTTSILQTASFAAAIYNHPWDADVLRSRGGFAEKTGLEARPSVPADPIGELLQLLSPVTMRNLLILIPKSSTAHLFLDQCCPLALMLHLPLVFAFVPLFLFRSDS